MKSETPSQTAKGIKARIARRKRDAKKLAKMYAKAPVTVYASASGNGYAKLP